ncbi:3-phosphoglycerate dehydrogenase family protein [Alcanivorax marinus]|uniref:3-phosphoglycerate dehydrogenase family protein n=1 Tax=Alloalcanivorax marinus TaxID=1177169 RepID=A0A9Q3URY0_9GAMM|nr:3-phosphoglycerate dehydrogenase family protein [Alloalcanivorax marinus]MCC4310342.1 3-phosphoglycerate dehydrogenase family protein [Alloalcanivorax marinus]
MLRIRTHNQIALRGLERFPRDRFEIASDLSDPDAILLRSHPLGADALPATVRAVARAGAGVNNIDVAHCSERGIPVFNTPGANANAVKELVLAGLLLSARHLRAGLDWVDALEAADEADLHRQVEAGKKQFQGRELSGRTLGVIGLGAIGSRVARIALHLGMRVIGYDPALSVDAAWRLPSQISPMVSLEALLARADFVTLHLPLLDATRDLIGAQQLAVMKPDAVLLNFARQGIVDDGAVAAALEAEALGAFVTDFPSLALAGARGVLTLPHLGASTGESEENCAMMAADALVDFLENGNIRHSVNFPELVLEPGPGARLAVTNRNVPRMLGPVLSELAEANLNVLDMLNKSRDQLAYNLLDLAEAPDPAVLARIGRLEGVINVRLVHGPREPGRERGGEP